MGEASALGDLPWRADPTLLPPLRLAQVAQTDKLIQEEQRKIVAYEAAFQQIKEATGVADVNEVIQRFLSQEETHQNLLSMTRDSQSKSEPLQPLWPLQPSPGPFARPLCPNP